MTSMDELLNYTYTYMVKGLHRSVTHIFISAYLLRISNVNSLPSLGKGIIKSRSIYNQKESGSFSFNVAPRKVFFSSSVMPCCVHACCILYRVHFEDSEADCQHLAQRRT